MSTYKTFKADFHRVYIQARKDPTQKWHDLPYLARETYLQEVIMTWHTESHAPSDLAVRLSMGVEISVAQKRKEVAKQVARNLDV